MIGCGPGPVTVTPRDSGPPIDGGATDAAVVRDAAWPDRSDAGPITSELTDPECTDGRYAEALPDRTASLDDLTFDGNVATFVDAVLERRYPFGLALVRGGRESPDVEADCSVFYASDPQNAAELYDRLPTIVHECGHIYDSALSEGDSNTYVIHDSTRFECDGGDTTARGGETFARSLILGDGFQSRYPVCEEGSFDDCDFYATLYLDGDPEDETFQSGDQGFNMLLEEVVQYVNSLATQYAYRDRLPPGFFTSGRDGILALLWYMQRYLHMARLEHPDAYAHISGEACWRDAILNAWGRAWLYLELTRDDEMLGIDDDLLESLVRDSALIDEIERIRVASDCP